MQGGDGKTPPPRLSRKGRVKAKHTTHSSLSSSTKVSNSVNYLAFSTEGEKLKKGLSEFVCVTYGRLFHTLSESIPVAKITSVDLGKAFFMQAVG